MGGAGSQNSEHGPYRMLVDITTKILDAEREEAIEGGYYDEEDDE